VRTPPAPADFREEHELRNQTGLSCLARSSNSASVMGMFPQFASHAALYSMRTRATSALNCLRSSGRILIWCRSASRPATAGAAPGHRWPHGVRDEVLRLREAVPSIRSAYHGGYTASSRQATSRTLHEQPAFLVHGETGRPSHDRQPARCEPRRDGGEQRGPTSGLRLALEESEESAPSWCWARCASS